MKYLVLKGIGVAGRFYAGAASTTIACGANSATQTLSSFGSIANGAALYFPATRSTASAKVTNTSARTVTLAASVATNSNDTVYINPTILDLDESSYGDTLPGHIAEGYLLPVDEGSANLVEPSSSSSTVSPPSSPPSPKPATSTTITVEIPSNDEIKIQPIGS